MDYVTRKEFRNALLTLYKELHQQKKTNRGSHESQDTNKHAAIPPVTKLDFDSSIEARKPAEDKKSDDSYHRWSLFAQWSTFVVVAIYTTVAAFQWCANKKAADAAYTSAEVSKKAQRAFVYFSENLNPIVVLDPKDNKKVNEVQFTIPIENGGVTQTRGLVFRVRAFPYNGPLPESFDFPDENNLPLIPTVLNPKRTSITQPIAVKKEVLNALKDRLLFPASGSTQRLFFYGWAKYWDVFQDRKTDTPHITKFCYEMTTFDRAIEMPDLATLHTFYSDCPRHNCTDEDCDAEWQH
jgi:hypothetical protein